ncbi:MAG: histone deacetylase [Monoraphidium minutum]|nr:MAG: histone deacetylase [Monoraphidium minutum]
MRSTNAAVGHAKEGHPECPERIAAIRDALSAAGLDRHAAARALGAADLAAWRRGGAARLMGAIELVHPRAYLERLEAICGGLQAPAMVDESTYIAPGSFEASLDTAAATLACLDVLVNCAAAAAAHALTRPGVSRVLVLDWDVHHGNGTEAVFYDSPDVLYISTHQQGAFPFTGKAAAVGAGEGAGATVNVPLPGGAGDAAARMAWDRVIVPAARRFKPDVIIVSAGYDAHWRDPLAALQLCSSTYHWLAAAARGLALELCGGRCLLVLEGGYHLPSLGESVAESLRGLLGLAAATPAAADLAAARLLQEEPLAKVERALAEAARLHSLG